MNDTTNDTMNPIFSYEQTTTIPTARKAVRFAPQTTTVSDSRPEGTTTATKSWEGVLTTALCKELWYQPVELARMKFEVKLAIATSNHKVSMNLDATPQEKEAMIGLGKYGKQRTLWTKGAIRYVLKIQHRVRQIHSHYGIEKDHYIPKIARRCTAWARDTAQKQGFLDYCAVYMKDHVEGCSTMLFGQSSTIDTSMKKRKIEAACDNGIEREEMDCGRRIRRKLPFSVLSLYQEAIQ